MLKIKIPSVELWDSKKQEFIYTKEVEICLEHSLVSLSKWESKWHKPFLTDKEHTKEETIDYIRCMTTTQNVDPTCYNYLSNDNIEEIKKYIEDPMTATWFNKTNDESSPKRNSEQITSELIYYWMIAEQIPVEFQKWHLNRLLTLIKVCNIKNQSPKKIPRSEQYNRNAALNKARRQALNSKG